MEVRGPSCARRVRDLFAFTNLVLLEGDPAMRLGTLIAVILVIAVSSNARAQTRQAQVDDIRRNIDALQKQLNSLETGQVSATQKVAQLGASRHQRGEPTLIVRVYDLSDLFSIAPAYGATVGNNLGLPQRALFPESMAALHGGGASSPGGMMGGGMGGMGGAGFFDVRHEPLLAQAGSGRAGSGHSATADVAASAKTSMQSLISAITSTIDPDSWEELSGPGSIARLGTSLIIRNDAAVHDQIDALFTLLRQKWRTLRTISVSAWWLPLTPTQVAGLLPGDGKGKTGVEGIDAFGIVDEAAWNRFLAADVQADKKAGAYRAVVTCYNGQTVTTTSGVEDGVVMDLEPVPSQGPRGSVAYRPTITPIHEGTALQITPLANATGRFVMLDVHSRVCVREPAAPVRRQPGRDDEHGPAAVIAALDRPRLITQHLATTLRTPVDRVMLIGGMTYTGVPAADDATLYLFLRTTVQELRDDVKQAAALEPAASADESAPDKDAAK